MHDRGAIPCPNPTRKLAALRCSEKDELVAVNDFEALALREKDAEFVAGFPRDLAKLGVAEGGFAAREWKRLAGFRVVL